MAIMTFVFPDSSSGNSPKTAPLAGAIPIPANSSACPLPSTLNPLSAISHDTTVAFSVPFGEASSFLDAVQEIPDIAGAFAGGGSDNIQTRSWVIKTARSSGDGSKNALRNWASNAWTSFVDLIKVCSTKHYTSQRV